MKKKKYISTIIILILLVFVFAILAFLVKRNDDKNNIDALQKISSDNQISSQIFISSENESADEKQPVLSEIEKEKAKPITILGAGDNLIHTGIYLQASRRANGNGYSFDYAYENVAEYVGSADISCLNQETPLTDFFEPSSYPMFNCPTKMGLQMIDIGFDVINQANNHALDKGENGVKYTIEFWDSVKDKAKMIGMYKNKQDEENVCIIDKDGTKISFVSYTQHTNGLSLPKSSEFVVSNENNIIERIKKAKSLSDIVVVNAHWGEEYTFTPND
ncbi:MAG: CapA family protein, partial [Oscillospiraceae bacterium]